MTQQKVRHVPVLFDVVMDFIRVRPGGTYVDCTLGLAGHAEGIVRQLGSAGHFIGFDRDPEALELARAQLTRVSEELGSQAPQVTLIGEAFSTIAEHVGSTQSMDCWPTLAPAACTSMRRAEGLVFRRTDRWTCVWTRDPADRRTSGE
jgi:16S rRNA C1402 N4-methylase RsmH